MKLSTLRILLSGVCFTFFMLTGHTVAFSQTINLRMAHFMSPTHIQHQKSFVPFTERVSELSAGKVKIKIYSGGALGGAKQLADAVKMGVADIAFIVPSYTTARFPRSSVFDLPYLFNSSTRATQAIYEVYDQSLAADFSDYKVLWLYTTTPNQLHSVTTAVDSLMAMKDKKIRTSSSAMTRAVSLLESNPVGMPVPKLRMSLEKKIIDGMLTPFCAVEDFKLFDHVKHITQLDFSVTLMAVVMNKEKFESLPMFAKNAIEKAAGKEMGLHAARVYEQHDANTLKKITSQGNIKIHQISLSDKQAITKRLHVLMENWTAEMDEQGFSGEEILTAVQSAAKGTEH